MRRLVVKPTVEALMRQKYSEKINMPYEWVNWWLYQKGEDQLIKHSGDIEHPLYSIIFINQSRVIEDLLRMVGGSDKAQEKLEELLNTNQGEVKSLDDLYEE